MKKIYSCVRLMLVLFLFFLTNSTLDAQTYQWKSLSMGGAGFVSGIITSKQERNLMYARTDVGGAYKWNAATGMWVPLLDWVAANQSGFYGVESIAVDPRATSKVYMMVGINYFDNGKSAILRSDNYGQTFTTTDVTNQFKVHGNGIGRSNGERLQVDPNLGSILYAGTRANGLFKSTDYGATWNRLNGLNITTTLNANGISFVFIDPASGTAGNPSQTIYVGVSRYASAGDNLYKSTDGGVTFNPVTGGPGAYMPQRAVPTNNGDLIINYANGAGPYGSTFGTSVENMDNGAIFKYNMVSGTWTNITPSGISRAWGGLTVDPNNPLRMMASTINNYQLQYASAYGDRIFLTTNGGSSWRDVVNPGFSLNNNAIPWIYGQAIHWAGSLEFDPFNTGKVYVTSGNGVFSNDNIDLVGNPWKFEVSGLEETVPTALVSLPGGPLFTTVGDYDGFKYTDLNAYGLRFTPTMGTTTGLAYAANNTNYLVRVGSKIYYSTDQGGTWTATAVINGNQGKVAVSADAATILHSPNGSNFTYYSRNNGTTWTASNISVNSAIPVADMVDPNKFYIYNSGSGNVNRSTDGGATFNVTVNAGSGGNKLIRAIPGKEGHLWVALYNGGLKRSVDAGTSFTTIAGVTACSAIGYGKAAQGATYLTLYIWGTVNGVTGIFRSVDEGANWVRLNTDATMFGGPGNAQFIMGDMNNYGVVYMSTVGRGVVVGSDPAFISLPTSLTSFTVSGRQVSAKQFALLKWNTATEINADHIEIEKSSDSRSWQQVGTVKSKALNGNSTAALTYDYTDDVTGAKGTIYFRLKMVNKDGSATYSSINALQTGKLTKSLSTIILPNPVSKKQAASIRIISAEAQRLTLSIVALNGSVLVQKNINVQEGSTNLIMAETAAMASGTYLLKITSANDRKTVATTKLVIQ